MLRFFRQMLGRGNSEGSEAERRETRRLQRRLASNAQTLSLRRLKKCGLQSVRVLDAATIQQVVAGTVDEALRQRDTSLTPREREEVQDFAAAQLRDLTAANEQLSAEKDVFVQRGGELQAQVEALRGELDRLNGELVRARAGAPPAPASAPETGAAGSGAPGAAAAPDLTRTGDEATDDSFADALAGGVGPAVDRPLGSGVLPLDPSSRPLDPSILDGAPFADIDERVRSILLQLLARPDLLALLEQELARPGTLQRAGPPPEAAWKPPADEPDERRGEAASPAAGGDESERVSMLERRITKLNRELEQKEELLRKLIEMKSIDPGVASIFTDVQGLDFDDPNFGRKSELLEEVFKQNLEIRDAVSEASGAAGGGGAGGGAPAGGAPPPPPEIEGFSTVETATQERSF